MARRKPLRQFRWLFTAILIQVCIFTLTLVQTMVVFNVQICNRPLEFFILCRVSALSRWRRQQRGTRWTADPVQPSKAVQCPGNESGGRSWRNWRGEIVRGIILHYFPVCVCGKILYIFFGWFSLWDSVLSFFRLNFFNILVRFPRFFHHFSWKNSDYFSWRNFLIFLWGNFWIFFMEEFLDIFLWRNFLIFSWRNFWIFFVEEFLDIFCGRIFGFFLMRIFANFVSIVGRFYFWICFGIFFLHFAIPPGMAAVLFWFWNGNCFSSVFRSASRAPMSFKATTRIPWKPKKSLTTTAGCTRATLVYGRPMDVSVSWIDASTFSSCPRESISRRRRSNLPTLRAVTSHKSLCMEKALRWTFSAYLIILTRKERTA